MVFTYTEEQNLLRDSLTKLVDAEYNFARRLEIINSPEGHSRQFWRLLAEQGVLGLRFDEDLGGFGGSASDMHVVMEVFGRRLLVEPFLPTVVLAGAILRHGASPAQKKELIPPIIRGEAVYAVALNERDGRYNLANVSTTASTRSGGYVLSGEKAVVYAAPIADLLIVTARTSGGQRDHEGVSLFVLDAHAEGVSRRDFPTVDGMRASELTFRDVRVGRDQLIGPEGGGLAILNRAMDETIAAACSEAVGAMAALNERTLDHCRTRVAFGQPLAKFQVVQHRLVDMRIAYEHAAGMAVRAARSLDQDAPARSSAAASAAKVQVGKEADFVATNAVQLHGAIGITDELDIGHYFRRLTAIGSHFGDVDHHLRRSIGYSELSPSRGAGAAVHDVLAGLAPEDEAFRGQVVAFLDANLSQDMRDASRFAAWAFPEFEMGRQWQKILHRQGWGAVHWPVELGGAGWSPTQNLIWAVECLRAGAPQPMSMGRDLVAPCLAEFGTPDQLAEFLPGILSGDDWWAQGFSEPGAGSDLAALQLAAVSDGDEFVLSGSKIWTSFAQYANRIFCLVRTGNGPKKQMGISFLLIDLDSPGIEIRPLHTIAGDHEFNEVFFTDVRVPKSRLLGAENEGWTVVRHLLTYEHGATISAAAVMSERFNWLREIMELEQDGDGHRLVDNQDFSRRLAEILIEVQGVCFLDEELAAAQRAGAPPSAIGELLTIRSREVGLKMNELAMRAVGVYATPYQKAARTVGSGVTPVGPAHALMPMPLFLGQRAATIAGGTSEIHRNNVAKHLLGL